MTEIQYRSVLFKMTENMRSVIQYNMIQGKHGIILIVKVEQRYKDVKISGKKSIHS